MYKRQKLRGDVGSVLLNEILSEDVQISIVSVQKDGGVISDDVFASADGVLVSQGEESSESSLELPEDVEHFLHEQIKEAHPGLVGYQKFLEEDVECLKNSEGAFFIVLRDKEGEILGINSGGVAVGGKVRVGKLYVSEKYRKDFNIGDFLYFVRDQFLDQGAQKYSTVAFNNPIWLLHLRHGWVLNGFRDDEILKGDAVFDITQVMKDELVDIKYQVICENEQALVRSMRIAFDEGCKVVGGELGDDIPKKLQDCFPCTLSIGSVVKSECLDRDDFQEGSVPCSKKV